MINFSKYRIDIKLEVIFIVFTGIIKISDVQEFLLELTSNPAYSNSFDKVYDFRYCNLSIRRDELPNFLDFIKNELDVDSTRKEIYITSKPNEVVVTTLYGLLIQEFQFHPHIVSTINKTIKILSNPNLNKDLLEKTLDELRITQPKSSTSH